MKPADLRARYAVAEEPLRSERRVELVMVLLGVLALLQLLWLLVSYLLPPRVDVVLPAPDSMEVETVSQVGTLTAEQSRSIRARPVFWDSRRPLEAPPVVVAETAGEDAADAPAAEKVLKGLTLSGIVANDDESRVIITYQKEQMRLAPGQDIAGWTLRSVQPDAAVFEDSGREVTLRLRPQPVVAAADNASVPSEGQAEAESAAAAVQRLWEEAQQRTGEETEEEPGLSLGG